MAEVREDGPFERILTVSVAGDALAAAESKAARKLAAEIKVKGFRPGKAPRRVVESAVGAETLRREAVELALPAVVAEANARRLDIAEPDRFEAHPGRGVAADVKGVRVLVGRVHRIRHVRECREDDRRQRRRDHDCV